MKARMTTVTATAPTIAGKSEEAGREGVALLMRSPAYSAASRLTPRARAEHSAITREARAIGFVR